MRRYIYFARAGDAIKIGCAQRPHRRMQEIERQIGRAVDLIGLIYGNFATETLIHRRLRDFAEGEEWFRDCDEVKNLISYLLAKGPYFQGLPPNN